ncbi:MAG: hypothetical protein KH301_07620 [Brachyspira sp.]|uniref:hypothetical protein n=1 Tax=Candidatus Scatousia sp. TaxID=3085663 RepID=UPI004027FB05|nr:hypothetical protein [Brachyspira sp.]
MAPFDKINGNLGNVNGFLFGKKVEKEKTEAKTDVPVGKTPEAAKTAKADTTNLNLDMNAIMGLHLTQQAGKVDTSEKATAARAAEFYANADFQALNKEFGIYDDIDPEIGQFLSPKTLSYIANATQEQRDRIGADTVNTLDKMIAVA